MHALDRLASGVLALSGSTLLLNLLHFKRPRDPLPSPAPFVSILVPARNEAGSIEKCVRSLLAQTYPAFELLVLDDQSEDGTGAILETIAREEREAGVEFRVLQGSPLPDGWSGKNWACHQLARAANARSEFLLFTDADTWHTPDTLTHSVGHAMKEDLALLSLMPEQHVEALSEQLVVTLLALQILGFLPLLGLERLPLSSVAAANGQFLLFRRDEYERCGGHAAFPEKLAEDVLLARLLKQRGDRLRLANGVGLVHCRMYHSHHQVIAGFRRSFAAGIEIGPVLVPLLVLLNFIAYLLPFLRAPFSRTARGLVALILALRTALAWQTHTPLRAVLLHPIGAALIIWIQLLGLYDAYRGNPTPWKGRHYGTYTSTNRSR